MNECNNVNEIIRVSLKSLTDTVKNQGLAIRDLSKKLSNKPSREEIDNYLKFKPTNEDNEIKIDNDISNEDKEIEEIKDQLLKDSINRYKIHKIKFKYRPYFLKKLEKNEI